MKYIKFLFFFLILFLLATRLVGLTWGFPYLFHPDENNINFAIQSLQCPNFLSKNCFNPHFYAYGQLTIYLGYLLTVFFSLLRIFETPLLAAAFSLRLISAITSIISGILLYLIIKKETKNELLSCGGLFMFIFTPGLIQSAHFGTTENILILSLLGIIYFKNNLLWQAFFVGIAAAAKPTGAILLILCFFYLIATGPNQPSRLIKRVLVKGFWLAPISLLFAVVLSPHYLINSSSFINTFLYETSVAAGRIPVFYTEQFRETLPIIFQFSKIFPYALGISLTFLGTVSIIFLFRKHRSLVLFFIFFLCSQAFLYAKWTRFVAPLFPLFILFSVLFFDQLISRFSLFRTILYSLFSILLLYQLCIGWRFFRIYLQPDIRITATEWINKNIPKNAQIISESGNVQDIPLNNYLYPNYESFFIYDLEKNQALFKEVFAKLKIADYVIIPSRRVIANYLCNFNNKIQNSNNKSNSKFKCQKHPKIQEYYDYVLDEKKFRLIKSFDSGLNDEAAEETWTVFDHPKVKIYKKLK